MLDWKKVLTSCGVAEAVAAEWAPVFKAEFDARGLSAGARELDDFLAQCVHESAHLTKLEEGMFYSVQRLCDVWPKRFPTQADAAPFARNPQALANKVYGGRLGNTGPNDGWLYRGSGMIQITGRANFAAVGKVLGIDLLSKPDLLRTDKAVALRASIAWWEGNVPDAVMDDDVKVRTRVNGGTIGLGETTKLRKLADAADGKVDGRLG